MEETSTARDVLKAVLALGMVLALYSCTEDEDAEMGLPSDTEPLLQHVADAPDEEALQLEQHAYAPRGRTRWHGTLALGDAHACAINGDREVVCWGSNHTGQLGNGTTEAASTPVSVVGLSDVVEVASGAGGYHTCARRRDGTVSCWGLNSCGQLGDGAASSCGPSVVLDTWSSVPVQVEGLTDASAISVGQYSSCALRRDTTVVCWGLNLAGGLGNGTNVDSGTPVPVSRLMGVVELAVGSGHSCARKSDGKVFCWGMNIDGRLGNGTATNTNTPSPVSRLRGAVAISAGNYHTCALGAGDRVFCWGNNQLRQVENGTLTHALIPTRVPGLMQSTKLAAGALSTCANQSDGSIACWGGSWVEEAAGNAADPRVSVRGVGHIVQLAAGGQHACARTRHGNVLCWGRNGSGELGNGRTDPQGVVLTPVRVIGL